MELRYRMAVVTGAGSGLGRELAVALGRRGMAVLVADRDGAAAEQTALMVRRSRVAAWAFQVDLAHESEVHLLAGRARDLGGADVLVGDLAGDVGVALVRVFLDDLAGRRTPSAPAAVVDVAAASSGRFVDVGDEGACPARQMSVRVRPTADAVAVVAALLRLLTVGAAGEAVAIG